MKQILKVLGAGIVALVILCLIFTPYATMPVHKDNPNGNTDYIWEPNSHWFKLIEGISFGTYDAKGYNNPQVVENPDILVVGSSHMEAAEVMQDENTAYLLGQAFDGEYTVYNTGISGHNLPRITQYLESSICQFDTPPKYVIMEAHNLNVTMEDISLILEGNYPKQDSHDSGVVSMLQKLPFLRLVYIQLERGLSDLLFPGEATSEVRYDGNSDSQAYAQSYTALVSYIRQVEDTYNTKIILFFHPTVSLQADSSLAFSEAGNAALLAQICREQGLTFLNMDETFLQLYQQEHKLPHGFVLGKLGTGHLNPDGHAAIAARLHQTILELEGRVCN